MLKENTEEKILKRIQSIFDFKIKFIYILSIHIYFLKQFNYLLSSISS